MTTHAQASAHPHALHPHPFHSRHTPARHVTHSLGLWAAAAIAAALLGLVLGMAGWLLVGLRG